MHIVNYSMGKDSTAMLILMLENNYPIDKVLWADLGRWAEFDSTYHFKSQVESKLKIKIETVSSDKWTWNDIFYSHPVRGKTNSIRGFAPTVGPGCRYRSWLKTDPLEEIRGINNDIYIGIAADESERAAAKQYTEDHKNRYYFPLIELGYTEGMCRELCLKYDLLHPLYSYFRRLGCWGCPKQSITSLRILWREFPGYWSALRKLQKDCPWNFCPDGSIQDLEERFDYEEFMWSDQQDVLLFDEDTFIDNFFFYSGEKYELFHQEPPWEQHYYLKVSDAVCLAIARQEVIEIGFHKFRYVGGREYIDMNW